MTFLIAVTECPGASSMIRSTNEKRMQTTNLNAGRPRAAACLFIVIPSIFHNPNRQDRAALTAEFRPLTQVDKLTEHRQK